MSAPLGPQLDRLGHDTDVDVDPAAIEAQLAALWREASETNGASAVTRACLWNVVAQVPHGAEQARHATLRDAIRRLPAYLANRTLLLDVGPEDPGRPALDAWVSANCLRTAGGGKLVCSEEVTLAARGDDARHLPSLVRALLVPGVPTAFVVAGVPDPDDPLTAAMLGLADRVVMDGDVAERGHVLEDAARALTCGQLGGMDLGWLRRGALRREVAGLFDPPATRADVDAIRRVFASASRAEASTARLVLGWVLGALGAKDPSPTGPHQWRFTRGARPIDVALEVDDSHHALTVAFECEGGEVRKVRCGSRLTSSGPGAGPDRPTGADSLEALVARALATRSEDAGFVAALEAARGLG